MVLEVTEGLIRKQWIYHTEAPSSVMQAQSLASIQYSPAVEISASHSTQLSAMLLTIAYALIVRHSKQRSRAEIHGSMVCIWSAVADDSSPAEGDQCGAAPSHVPIHVSALRAIGLAGMHMHHLQNVGWNHRQAAL